MLVAEVLDQVGTARVSGWRDRCRAVTLLLVNSAWKMDLDWSLRPNRPLTKAVPTYQIDGTAASSSSIERPSGRMWMIRSTPFARSIGASIPTRWQFARGVL